MGYNVSDYNIKNNNIDDILSELKELDFVFIALHGAYGEDGKIQRELKYHNIKFNGSDYFTSSVCFDKIETKRGSIKIPGNEKNQRRVLHSYADNFITPPCFNLSKQNYQRYKDYEREDRLEGLSLTEHLLTYLKLEGVSINKFVIKPNTQGSSVGFSLVEDHNQMINAIEEAFNHESYADSPLRPQSILIEEYIDGKEITVPILNDIALPIIEIKPKSNIYDYNSKYKGGASEYICPADLDESLSKKICEAALIVHKYYGCKVYSRIDYRLDKKNKFWFLEVNTLPGMTETSLFPMAAKASGLSFEDLIDKIIKLSLEK